MWKKGKGKFRFVGMNMRKVLIKDIGKVITGNTPSKTNSEFYSSKDIGFVKPDIIADSGISSINFTNEYISEKARSKARIVEKDTVFVTCIGTIGKVGIAEGREYAFNQQINAIEVNEKAISRYLAYNLLSNKNRLVSMANAPVVPIINKTQFENFEILIDENIDSQKKIVNILDKVSQIILLKRSQLNELDNLIKSQFVKAFGNPMDNPYGWVRIQLDDCLETIDNGKSFVCENNARVGSNPAILKLSAVTYGRYNPDENKAIINKKDFVESAEVHDGDLLFTRKNTPELVGMSAYVMSASEKLMMPDLIFRLNTKKNCNKVFLWQLINHDLFRNEIKNLASGSAKSMSNISKERLRKLFIYLPPIDLQEKFAIFVQQVDRSRGDLQNSLDEMQLLFDSLMKKYFN